MTSDCEQLCAAVSGFETSSFCSKGACVEVSVTPITFHRAAGVVMPPEVYTVSMRDTKHPGPTLNFWPTDWAMLCKGVRNGEASTAHLRSGVSLGYGDIRIEGIRDHLELMVAVSCGCGCVSPDLRFNTEEWHEFLAGMANEEFELESLLARPSAPQMAVA